MSNLKTIVLNYAPLIDRAEWMADQLRLAEFQNYCFHKYNYNYNYYLYDSEKALIQGRATSSEYHPRELTRAEFDLLKKHQYALIDACNTNEEWVLILEDDALLKQGYNYEFLLKKVQNAPKDCDIIVAGGPFDHSICTYSKHYPEYLLANHPSTNTSSSIIYKKSSILQVIEDLQYAQTPLDWALNYIYKKNNFKVWHMFPYLFTQNKNFKSSIQ